MSKILVGCISCVCVCVDALVILRSWQVVVVQINAALARAISNIEIFFSATLTDLFQEKTRIRQE